MTTDDSDINNVCDDSCTICFGDLNEKGMGRVAPDCCTSTYCINCFVIWTRKNNTCPGCRTNMTTEKEPAKDEEVIDNGDILFTHTLEWNIPTQDDLVNIGLELLFSQIRQF